MADVVQYPFKVNVIILLLISKLLNIILIKND